MTRYHATCLAVLLATAACLCADKAGTEKEIAGIKLCWCPPGSFMMGSPPKETDRRADEVQVKVTQTKGFWTAKYKTTQGQWMRVMGKLPGKATAELPEDADMLTSTARVESDGTITVSMRMNEEGLRAELYEAYTNG